MLFYHGHNLVQILETNPLLGFMVNYLCAGLTVYLGGFLLSKALIECP